MNRWVPHRVLADANEWLAGARRGGCPLVDGHEPPQSLPGSSDRQWSDRGNIREARHTSENGLRQVTPSVHEAADHLGAPFGQRITSDERSAKGHPLSTMHLPATSSAASLARSSPPFDSAPASPGGHCRERTTYRPALAPFSIRTRRHGQHARHSLTLSALGCPLLSQHQYLDARRMFHGMRGGLPGR
eukprot:ctg_2635.g638